MATAELNPVNNNRYGYFAPMHNAASLAGRGVELITCKNSNSILKHPFYAVAGLVALVASAVIACVEVPIKIALNTAVFFANKISNLICGEPGPSEEELQATQEAKAAAEKAAEEAKVKSSSLGEKVKTLSARAIGLGTAALGLAAYGLNHVLTSGAAAVVPVVTETAATAATSATGV